MVTWNIGVLRVQSSIRRINYYYYNIFPKKKYALRWDNGLKFYPFLALMLALIHFLVCFNHANPFTKLTIWSLVLSKCLQTLKARIDMFAKPPKLQNFYSKENSGKRVKILFQTFFRIRTFVSRPTPSIICTAIVWTPFWYSFGFHLTTNKLSFVFTQSTEAS